MSPRLVLGAVALVASCARPAPSEPVHCDHGAPGPSTACTAGGRDRRPRAVLAALVSQAARAVIVRRGGS